jgi:hypothetical protein
MAEIKPQVQELYQIYMPIEAKLIIVKLSGGPMTDVLFDIDLGNSWMLSGASSGPIDLDVNTCVLILEITC